MGLSTIEVGFYGRLMKAGAISPGGTVLELGESHTLSDSRVLLDLIAEHLTPDTYTATLAEMLECPRRRSAYQRRFGPARALYKAIFRPKTYISLDPDLRRTISADLNYVVELGEQFDYCINNGTSEHVFNQMNVFKVMHDHTKAGGVMIHWTPMAGWLDHGFYNAQPGLFFDLAAANGYGILHVELASFAGHVVIRERADIGAIARDNTVLREALICVAMTKTSDAALVIPLQGAYGRISQSLITAATVRAERHEERRPNIALHKPATQSSMSVWSWSDLPEEDASGATNGLLTGYYGFHTDLEDAPWWSVDLGEVVPIAEIVLYNRLDSTADRANRLSILASSDSKEWVRVYERTEDRSFGGIDGNPLRVRLAPPVTARYVRVQLTRRNYLHLDGVEIFSVAASPGKPPGGASIRYGCP